MDENMWLVVEMRQMECRYLGLQSFGICYRNPI